MKPDDLFDTEEIDGSFDFGAPVTVYTLKTDLILELTKGARAGVDELELARVYPPRRPSVLRYKRRWHAS